MQLQKNVKFHHDATDASDACDEYAGVLHLRNIVVKNDRRQVYTYIYIYIIYVSCVGYTSMEKLVYAVAIQIMIYI